MKFKRLAILGVGLIGGSLALGLRRADMCQTIIGYGRNRDNLLRAKELGVIDEFTTSAEEAATGADLVVVATPLATNEKLFSAIASSLGSNTVITDVGSAKECVVDAARLTLGSNFPNFVPGHPIAGKEKSGVDAAVADLFEDHLVILTPLGDTSINAISVVTQMWEAVLADVTTLQVEHHDAVLAATSHLPHMLAYALVDCLTSMQENEDVFQFAAGGFRDFTRIASSNPQMWHDICFSNSKSLLTVLGNFEDHLQALKQAIENGDSEKVLEIFSRAKQSRDEYVVGK
ncbi:MAG: prephenate dehydrogenase/arogenate dehydrogenase family protein [Gammaproteobacteria bacterium]|nr:prephenate dehydrogenase/arogenate dehydrogenase family protein [Gammaproteobacteria bacterium]